ncbi:heme exporter protein CcmD [Aliiroseovarius sp.]|uniref:heme exporter protein CcmD n=1 Tax=Aliiroseovarius sp. TaxID=1872442 RepID=UPI002609105A|nr:heme exporter protein CcmD [Aliiroseovarius sp.]
MLDLGKYAGAVMSSWGVTILLLVLLGVITWRQSVNARARLKAAEDRRKARNG